MRKYLALVAALCLAVQAQEYLPTEGPFEEIEREEEQAEIDEWLEEGFSTTPYTSGEETIVELSLSEIVFPDGYEELVVTLQQRQVPELSDDQLAELEEEMTEEHYQFVMDLINDIKLSTTTTTYMYYESEFGENDLDMNSLEEELEEEEEEEEWENGWEDGWEDADYGSDVTDSWWRWLSTTTWRPISMPADLPALPDESHWRDYDDMDEYYYYRFPIWAMVLSGLAGLALIAAVITACCRCYQRSSRNVRYQNFQDETYPEEKKVPIV